jgi:glycosyltransferase involved in cell wall biosynthesis
MTLTFITEARYYKAKNGKYYAWDISYNAALFERYLKYYDKIYVVARVFSTEECDESFLVDNVEFLPLHPYHNIAGFFKNSIKNTILLKKYITSSKVVIARGGGFLAFQSIYICKIKNIKIGVEVIGDPDEVFVKSVVNHPLTPLFRLIFTQIQKTVIKSANSVLYVTRHKLQNKYPARKGTFVTHASNVMLKNEDFVYQTREIVNKEFYNLISVGSLTQMYKSPDIVIETIQLLNNEGCNVKLTWLGEGANLQKLQEVVNQLNLQDSISFLGVLPKEKVKAKLDESDIFVLVSRTEGLPRAMVEAMARGLPCIGSNVGGIPELISNEMIVAPNDPRALADKVKFLINNPIFTNKQATLNLNNAKEYAFERLEKNRFDFYKSLN